MIPGVGERRTLLQFVSSCADLVCDNTCPSHFGTEPFRDVFFFPLMWTPLWLPIACSLQCVVCKALPRPAQLFYQPHFLPFLTWYSNPATWDALLSGGHTGCFIVCMPLFIPACLLATVPQLIPVHFGTICQLLRPWLVLLFIIPVYAHVSFHTLGGISTV